MASLRKPCRGRGWEVRWVCPLELRERSKTFSTKTAAYAFKADRERDALHVRDGLKSPTEAALPGKARRVSMRHLCDAYYQHARGRYRKADGRLTSMVGRIGTVRNLLKPYWPRTASAFSAKDLAELRDAMLASGTRNRETLNATLSLIRQMFRWAARPEHDFGVTAQQIADLATVTMIRKGERPEAAGDNGVREPNKVKPAKRRDMRLVRRYLPPSVRGLLRLEYLMGTRPVELTQMRACDLDLSPELPAEARVPESVWAYRLKDAKTGDGTAWFGPRAQRVLRLFLRPMTPDQEREALLAGEPVGFDFGDYPLFPNPRARSGTYNTKTVGYALRRACDKAGVKFTSRQLRHNKATRTNRQAGPEVAGATLGHRKGSAITERVYIDSDVAAVELAARTG